uniref:Multifunctional fusion protein n=1 Tax=Titanophycus setchellii TaxID=940129 RepID=A0A1G4NY64_9FLOR|nr:Translation elongation factor Ts [Titanophycus setchellii]SCW23592.1 Translation elongation factor Ts [Titanophycus setchellii]
MVTEISAQFVKELRTMTGAGMMDCKKALQETDGNIDKAIEHLRQKGLASASKKSGRRTAEGLIESYIHAGSKIGVMVELNCETDFVARRIEFQELAKNIAMQIAACPQVEYIDIKSIPLSIIDQEKAIESAKDDICNKPADVQVQIIKGRVEKRLNELSLMNQSFIRNTDITIEDLINEKISLMGENIKISRFVRFLLGEGIERNEQNFSEEVANMIKS